MYYKNLVFDLYGTLVDIHTEEDDTVWEKTALFYRFYGADYTGEQLHAACDALVAAQKAQAGQAYECYPEVQIETVFTALFEAKGVQPAQPLGKQAAQLFRILSIEYIQLYPYVLEALAALRDEGRKLWLLTNAQRVFTEYEIRALGLEDAFDGIYISSDSGVSKPNVQFFRQLLDEQNLDPFTCLMIGNDRSTDVAGARAAGMDALYLHTNLSPLADAPCNAEEYDPRFTKKRPMADYETGTSDWSEVYKTIQLADAWSAATEPDRILP